MKPLGPAAAQIKNLLAQIFPSPTIVNNYTDAEKMEIIEKKFAEIMEVLGLDLSDDSLAETPHRMAKMYVRELFSGLDPSNFPKMTVLENKMKYDQMIVVQDINVMSVCEHHFQTIQGFATVVLHSGTKSHRTFKDQPDRGVFCPTPASPGAPHQTDRRLFANCFGDSPRGSSCQCKTFLRDCARDPRCKLVDRHHGFAWRF